ncbi:MAG TPA: Co2+/Mg2+ efflux protein ApaG [Aeromonadales bacterium]|nr:Co2+/Mg2+ efflux protein ApaG [Aeromonadales bacterium]
MSSALAKFEIAIAVETQYLPEQSEPAQEKFVFVYEISIHNRGQEALQLISRHWVITDGNQQVLEVDGAGVIGQQPRIEPGETYRYSSGTLLETPVGMMEGTYDMVSDDGESFIAQIPCFHLTAPGMIH